MPVRRSTCDLYRANRTRKRCTTGSALNETEKVLATYNEFEIQNETCFSTKIKRPKLISVRMPNKIQLDTQ